MTNFTSCVHGRKFVSAGCARRAYHLVSITLLLPFNRRRVIVDGHLTRMALGFSFYFLLLEDKHAGCMMEEASPKLASIPR